MSKVSPYTFSHGEKAGVGTVDPSREAAVGGSCPVERLRITALECDAYAALMRLKAENFFILKPGGTALFD